MATTDALRADTAAQEAADGGSAASAPLVLYVDDDAPLRAALPRALAPFGLAVEAAADAPQALAWLAARRPDLLLLDLSLPTSPGEATAAALRARWGDGVPIVVLSAGDHAAARAEALGAYDYLRKPFDLALLLDALQGALRQAGRAAP